jgi:hypothetical protein
MRAFMKSVRGLTPCIIILFSLQLLGVAVDRMYDLREAPSKGPEAPSREDSPTSTKLAPLCPFPLPFHTSRAQGLSTTLGRDVPFNASVPVLQRWIQGSRVERTGIPNWWEVETTNLLIRSEAPKGDVTRLAFVSSHLLKEVDDVLERIQQDWRPPPQPITRIRCFRERGPFISYSAALGLSSARAFFDPVRDEIITYWGTEDWPNLTLILSHELAHVRLHRMDLSPARWPVIEAISEYVAHEVAERWGVKVVRCGDQMPDPVSLVSDWTGREPKSIPSQALLEGYAVLASLARHCLQREGWSLVDWFKAWASPGSPSLVQEVLPRWRETSATGGSPPG